MGDHGARTVDGHPGTTLNASPHIFRGEWAANPCERLPACIGCHSFSITPSHHVPLFAATCQTTERHCDADTRAWQQASRGDSTPSSSQSYLDTGKAGT